MATHTKPVLDEALDIIERVLVKEQENG